MAVERRGREVQRFAGAATGRGAEPGKQTQVQQLAAQGVAGPPEALPFADRIAGSFGPAHADTVRAIGAHTGGAATAASEDIGARAYATGDQVAFAGTPDLHTAAHEAAHVVQQRQGVSLAGGVGEAGDPYERHADAVADRVVGGLSAASLLGDGGASASATPVQRKADPKPGRGHQKAPDPKEASWASPSTAPAATPAHVGAVFFHTKESQLDDADEAVLTALAKAYAPWAKRNLGHHGAALGLAGRVIGHADPRPSVEPNNQQLSLDRAHTTATRLARALARESGLAEGDFDLAVEGGGVEQAAHDGPMLEDPLPHQRRADIYLEGQAGAPEAKGGPAPETVPTPQPPVIKGGDYSDWDRWEHEIRNGDQRIIRDVSLRIVGNLMVDPVSDQLFWGPVVTALVGKGNIEPFKPIKPPWWDGRTSQIDIGQGRGATARKGLVFKMLLLKRDYKEAMSYEDVEFSARSGAYLTMIEAIRAGSPDPKLLAEAHVKLGYLLFMLDAVSTEALEVSKMAGADD